MWEINLSGQVLSFFYAILLGVLLCFIYDFFKSLRLTFKPQSIVVFFQDILYFFIIALFSFIFFLIFTGGEIRFFILFGLSIGFLFWKSTFSRFSVIFFRYVLKFFQFIFTTVNSYILKFLSFLGSFLPKLRFFFKNIQNRLKKLLKISNGLLYTKQE